MPQQESREFKAGVASCSDNGYPRLLHLGAVGTARVLHRSNSSIRFCTKARAAGEGVITRIVSSPAIVPAISFMRSASTAAASGCAPPGGVFSTSRFARSEEHTSELQSRGHLVCRLLLEKKK